MGITPPSVPGFSANRIRTKRVTTGSVAAGGGAVVVTVTWDTPFADANYTATPSVLQADFPASNTLKIGRITAQVAGSINVRVINDDALNAFTGTIHAIAISDA